MPHTFSDVAARVNVDELERGILDFWEQEKIFQQSIDNRADADLFTFYDGPPYATGKPHYGHVLQSAIKDTVLRYKTMQGYQVPRRVGWDTHGLPVEVLVEKELGFRSKQDIETYGIAEFNAKCREVVFRYIDEFTTTLKRLGRWADYANAYTTLDRDFMESEWWAFKQLWDKKLIYKDFRSTPYCIRCATPLSNFETGMAYRDRVDEAVYVKLPVVGMNNLCVLVWTTTPWTLPANVAVAFNPDLEYVTATVGDDSFIMARDRVEQVLGQEAAVVKTWEVSELEQLIYEPLFPAVARALKLAAPPFSLVPSAHVTSQDGTGLVHLAPAFGADDAIVAKQAGLPTLKTVDTNGKIYAEIPNVGGMNLFAANAPISADLEARGLLFKREQYTHSYPHCWRCDKPLIYYALDTWFVRVSKIKERLLSANEKINWVPEHLKQGRFKKGLESAPDWAVTRNRFWSVPAPIWECDACGISVCMGSVAELAAVANVTDIPDLHRPYTDTLTWNCTTCAGTMRRIPEVLDVWFDSGSMQFAQEHYPFEHQELVEQSSPADFIVESIEMTRAWFYVLHVLAVAIKDEPAFVNVIGSGIIFGADGKKLSKKLKNYPDIDPTLVKYGADTIRMFFMMSTFGEPYVFAENSLKELQRNLYQTLWNVYSFFVRYAQVLQWQPGAEAADSSNNILDQWIMARSRLLELEVITDSEQYRFDLAARHFSLFVDDLSNWYVRRSRSRFQVAYQTSAADTQAALATLHLVLTRLCRLLAPFMPFVTEAMYQNLTGEPSVHLTSLPKLAQAEAAVTAGDRDLVTVMRAARDIVSAGLALRARAGIKVRQPLTAMIVPATLTLTDELQVMMCQELNVEQLIFGELPPESPRYVLSSEQEKVRVALDILLTPELKAAGAARDIIRQGQQLRREAGYGLDDRIELLFVSQDAALQAAFATHQDQITGALQVDTVVESMAKPDAVVEVIVAGAPATVGVRKP